MAFPPLASLADFKTRSPEEIAAGDESRASALLEDASALIRAEASKSWVNASNELEDVPPLIVVITVAVARRAFINPDGVESEAIGDFSQRFASSSSAVYLTDDERRSIHRAAGKAGLWTQPTTREDVAGDVPDVYLDVEPAGEPIPWERK